MDFTSENFTKLLPDFLTSTEKNRLKTQLAQFSKWNRKDNDNLKVNKSDSEINYDLFYRTQDTEQNVYFQGDRIVGVPFPIFKEGKYSTVLKKSGFLLLSNTCDMALENKKSYETFVTLAPLELVSVLKEELLQNNVSDVQSFIYSLKQQRISNFFYLPASHFDLLTDNLHEGFFCAFDKTFHIPLKSLYKNKIEDIRVSSFSHFGFYLLVTKLSYHSCRLPEDNHR